MNNEISLLVVLYHPTYFELCGIIKYATLKLNVYVHDNTEGGVSEEYLQILKSCDNVFYNYAGANIGLSEAYNLISSKALKGGSTYLVTLDQDTVFNVEHLECYLDKILKCDIKNVGLFAPRVEYNHKKRSLKNVKNSNPVVYHEIKWAISSGSCLSLDAWKAVGGFDKAYFIDYLDYDYCIQLRNSYFKIIEVSNIKLNQNLGLNVKKLGFNHASHNSLRHYYMFRNRLYFHLRKSGYFMSPYLLVFAKSIKHIIEIVLFEDNSWTKIKACLTGFQDYWSCSMGKKL